MQLTGSRMPRRKTVDRSKKEISKKKRKKGAKNAKEEHKREGVMTGSGRRK